MEMKRTRQTVPTAIAAELRKNRGKSYPAGPRALAKCLSVGVKASEVGLREMSPSDLKLTSRALSQGRLITSVPTATAIVTGHRRRLRRVWVARFMMCAPRAVRYASREPARVVEAQSCPRLLLLPRDRSFRLECDLVDVDADCCCARAGSTTGEDIYDIKSSNCIDKTEKNNRKDNRFY